jgi:hypothetical protein
MAIKYSKELNMDTWREVLLDVDIALMDIKH